MVLDWFFPYAAGVANALAEGWAQPAMVTRDRTYEMGGSDDQMSVMRAMLDPRIPLLTIGGRQRDPRSLRDILKVQRQVRQLSPDVLHVQDCEDWRLYVVQRLLPRVPIVMTIHDVVFHEGEADRGGASFPIRRYVRRSDRAYANAYIVHGRQLADTLAAQDWYRGQQINIIPHGRLPYAASQAPLPATPTILLFGRLEYYKGLDLLVEAAELAARRVDGLKVIVAGQGSDVRRCQALVKSHELFEWRLGFVPNEATAALFAESSVVVLPYRDASQSGVVPMAFANGRPVIATNVGALSEAVHDGEDGLLVGEASPKAIATAIVRMFTEPGLLHRLTAGAEATVSTGPLAPAHIAELHLQAYLRVARLAGI